MVDILPLTLHDVQVYKRRKRLIGPIDLTLGPTGTTIVMGPNGSGKTTLLRLLHGLERVGSGQLNWAVATTEAHRHQAYVFQSPIMMRRSVCDCIAYPLLLRGVAKKDARAQAADWAEKVGLADALQRNAKVLSGGEKQKLALARALIRKPKVLFLDEPCANLDGAATSEIETILQTARSSGTRIIMATHDMGQAKRLADDVLFLLKGRIHETNAATPFFETPQTPEAKAFLNGDLIL